MYVIAAKWCWSYIFIPKIADNVYVSSGVADKLPLEECDVDDGGVEVDELEDEDFESEVVIEIWLCSVHFWNTIISMSYYLLQATEKWVEAECEAVLSTIDIT